MQNGKLFAFSIYVKQCPPDCGVVVQDGRYLRYGKIIRQIQQSECKAACQIIMFDENNTLGDYLHQQSNAALLLSNSFLNSKNFDLKISEIEMVSFSSRSLFRIRVTDSKNPYWDNLIRFLISIFAIAIEIYE